MRKFIDILTEMRRGLAPIGEMSARVFWNPLHSDLVNLINRSSVGDVRGSYIRTNSEVMWAIWPARSLSHWNFHNECFMREGIVAVDTIDMRIVKDYSVLSDEKYWHDNSHYEGVGFSVHFLIMAEMPIYPKFPMN